jgi:hypothetical protein
MIDDKLFEHAQKHAIRTQYNDALLEPTDREIHLKELERLVKELLEKYNNKKEEI